jgi:hypothetical protein
VAPGTTLFYKGIDRMNATEKKYAVNRIEEIAKTAKGKIETLAGVKELTNNQMVALLRSGNVSICKRPMVPNWGRPTIDQVFDFRPFRSKPKLSDRQRCRRLEKLACKIQSVKDQIMLGDNASAVKAIQEFTVFCAKAWV